MLYYPFMIIKSLLVIEQSFANNFALGLTTLTSCPKPSTEAFGLASFLYIVQKLGTCQAKTENS